MGAVQDPSLSVIEAACQQVQPHPQVSHVRQGKIKTGGGPLKPGQAPQGVVAWDVQVTNQLGELVASYDILTLVAKRGA